MKKIFIAFILISALTNAQNSIEGFISPNIDSDWLILYKIEGTEQVYVKDTKIKKDSIAVNGNQREVGSFKITLPNNAEPGTYRATYRLEGQGFIDFVYNKEDVSFIFNPDYPTQSVAFTQSEENKLYREYIDAITKVQQTLDSIQVSALQNPELNLSDAYSKAYTLVKNTQTTYEEKTKGYYIQPFVKSSLRSNLPTLISSIPDYMGHITGTFFDNIDFSNQVLINSSFITNRILDYIFYIHYAEDLDEQNQLHRKAIETVLSKINSLPYKRDIIEFLVDQYETSRNIIMIDYLFEEHYNALPKNLQNQKFKSEKMAKFAAEVGRTAPNFSWTENGVIYDLASLNDAEHYVLVFWSTSCSHCLREIPQLYDFMKNQQQMKVIGFALENDALVWEQYSKNNLQGWHNVLGLNKWENKTARTYQINATPSYFVLDKNKKIIAKPNEFEDVKAYINTLKM